MRRIIIPGSLQGIHGVPSGGGAEIASFTDDNPDLDWGSCSPGEERVLTVTNAGEGGTFANLVFSGDTDAFEITSLDGVSVGPFGCDEGTSTLRVALGDAGDVLYGVAAEIGISTVYTDGSAKSMTVTLVDAGGETVAIRTCQATVQDPLYAELLGHVGSGLLGFWSAADMALGDLAGHGSSCLEEQMGTGEPNILYQKHASQSVHWSTGDGDPCGESVLLNQYLRTDRRAGYWHASAYEYGIIASALSADVRSIICFIQLPNDPQYTCDLFTLRGHAGSPAPIGPAQAKGLYAADSLGDKIGIGMQGQYIDAGSEWNGDDGEWYCVCYTMAAAGSNQHWYAVTKVGNAFGDVIPWTYSTNLNPDGPYPGFQFHYINEYNIDDDNYRYGGVGLFSDQLSEAEFTALYNAAAGL